MSVIIKDMEMPRACWCCGGCDGDEKIGYFCVLTPEGKDIDEIDIHYGKPSWCPLVEISTPHGRLIDEKELYNKIEREFDGCCVYDVAPYEAVNDFEEIVDQCKTIIEAEE